jgi:hypothetical protein
LRHEGAVGWPAPWAPTCIFIKNLEYEVRHLAKPVHGKLRYDQRPVATIPC